MLSIDGTLREPASLAGLRFISNNSWSLCAASDATPGSPAKPWPVRDIASGRCSLYDPSGDVIVQHLPGDFLDCTYAATSGDGRYAAATRERDGWLLLYDGHTNSTKWIELPRFRDGAPIEARQLSVDSEGSVFVNAGTVGVRIFPEGRVQLSDFDRPYTNYLLSPNERFLVTNDATGTSLRLEDLHGECSMTLCHPAAVVGATYPKIIRGITFAPGLTAAAVTDNDGSLLVFNLVGAERNDMLHPALHVRLRLQYAGHPVTVAAPCFARDGSAIHVGYRHHPAGDGLRVMKVPLI